MNTCDISKRVVDEMSPEEIRSEINELLYIMPDRCKSVATDPELLTITVLQSKSRHFDFLKGDTNFRTVGTWEGMTEPNITREIQFKDTKKEEIGNRLKDLLGGYNKKVVGEQLLYFRTVPIEETSL